jgi:hypothetical protein
MNKRSFCSIFAGVLLASVPAFGAAVSSFGLLSGANFGGSGIDNTAVAITTYSGVTLGLTATPRYSNPPVTNDGISAFFATAGVDPAQAGYAQWNFDFYISNAGASFASYTAELWYDFDPAAATSTGLGIGIISLPSPLFAGTTTVQDSWNLGMSFLATGAAGLTPPTYSSFDPTASGEYSFALVLKDSTAAEVARSSITVNVASVPDGGSMVALLGVGLMALVGVRRTMRG